LAMRFLVRAFVADLVAVADYATALARDGTALAPRLNRAGFAPELSLAIARLRRAWSAQRRALEALAASKQAVLDTVPDPIVMVDRERRVVRLNAAAQELLGARAVGRDLAAVLRNPAVLEAADAVLAGKPRAEVRFSTVAPVERN